jgi:hypothetical protein
MKLMQTFGYFLNFFRNFISTGSNVIKGTVSFDYRTNEGLQLLFHDTGKSVRGTHIHWF